MFEVKESAEGARGVQKNVIHFPHRVGIGTARRVPSPIHPYPQQREHRPEGTWTWSWVLCGTSWFSPPVAQTSDPRSCGNPPRTGHRCMGCASEIPPLRIGLGWMCPGRSSRRGYGAACMWTHRSPCPLGPHGRPRLYPLRRCERISGPEDGDEDPPWERNPGRWYSSHAPQSATSCRRSGFLCGVALEGEAVAPTRRVPTTRRQTWFRIPQR